VHLATSFVSACSFLRRPYSRVQLRGHHLRIRYGNEAFLLLESLRRDIVCRDNQFVTAECPVPVHFTCAIQRTSTRFPQHQRAAGCGNLLFNMSSRTDYKGSSAVRRRRDVERRRNLERRRIADDLTWTEPLTCYWGLNAAGWNERP
jgi:hypothetical protein